MKLNKQIIIPLILFSMLLSALGAAYYFYTQNKISIQKSNQLIIVYVASKNIKKGIKITKADLKTFKTARKFILGKPLVKKDIIGKFAKDIIYKNDTFTKNRVTKTIKKLKIKNTILKDFKFNSYNIKFSLFQNPNLSIKQNDIINIISVYPAIKEKVNGSSNAVQYVAKEIKVLGFLIQGEESNTISKIVKRSRIVKKKRITEHVTLKADEFILDINGKVLLSLIDDYNRGHQLWMVKTKYHTVTKEKFPKIEKTISKKHKIAKKYYPYILYKSKNKFKKLQATIHYADQNNPASTKKETIKLSTVNLCVKEQQFLIGISKKVYLRQEASTKDKVARLLYRNYIIPYNKKINNQWYQTCDGLFVHINEATQISKKLAYKKLKR